MIPAWIGVGEGPPGHPKGYSQPLQRAGQRGCLRPMTDLNRALPREHEDVAVAFQSTLYSPKRVRSAARPEELGRDRLVEWLLRGGLAPLPGGW